MTAATIDTLEWHRAGTAPDGCWISRAWAPALNPEATMPPYYEIRQIQRNQAARSIRLVECRTCGGNATELWPEDTLAAAKWAAQADYRQRIKQQTVDKPS